MSDDKTYPYIEWNADPCDVLPHKVVYGAEVSNYAWLTPEVARLLQFGIDHAPQAPKTERVPLHHLHGRTLLGCEWTVNDFASRGEGNFRAYRVYGGNHWEDFQVDEDGMVEVLVEPQQG